MTLSNSEESLGSRTDATFRLEFFHSPVGRVTSQKLIITDKENDNGDHTENQLVWTTETDDFEACFELDKFNLIIGSWDADCSLLRSTCSP